MPVSYSTVSTQNMELSPMRVSFGPAGSEVDLGGSLGNVSLSIKYTKAEIMADQSGKTVRDRRVSAQMIQVTTELAEIQNKDIWKIVFPHAKEVVSGMNKQIYFQAAIGDSDLANAKSLILHPLSKQNSDKSGDYLFYKAVASAESEIVYGPEQQAKLKIVWNILPDDSVQPERFMLHGDPAIGLVAASAGAAVAGANTGDGTIGTIVAYSSYTKTETITITCVGDSSGNDFVVSGSLSGALGSFHIAAAAASTASFSVPVLSFVMTQGATQFAYGDSFTIATVASNYS